MVDDSNPLPETPGEPAAEAAEQRRTAARRTAPAARRPARKPASAKQVTIAAQGGTEQPVAVQKAAAKRATAKKAPSKAAAPKKTTAPKQTTAKKAAAPKTTAPTKAAPARPAAAPAPTRDFDIVVYGATGFVGMLVVDYLARHAPPTMRIGLAGRNPARLVEVRNRAAAAADWELLIADSDAPDTLVTMAARTKVLITTVGPYLKYGLPVVAACAEQGTHYVDLTGEVLFMRRSIDEYDAAAKASGARIVHSCGFDSIPSDLGVFALHQAAARDGDGTLERTRFALVQASGGFSGGTVASLLGQLDAVERDGSLRKIVGDPYALSPDRSAEPDPGDGGDLMAMAFDRQLKSWVSPFVMASVNTRVVRRTNALLGFPYGKAFRYQEVTAHGAGPLGAARAAALAGGMGVGMAALAFGPSRGLVGRFLPQPGDGPDEAARERGRFAVRLVSRTSSGRRVDGLVAAQGDPGYLATSMMISECALALALQEEQLPDVAGVLTPATALGQVAIDRLRAAGMTITAHVV
jgi:short subunit dehydrogenase-like uncharacterized protein